MIYVSPAEQQPTLKALGASAPFVEEYGADYLWFVGGVAVAIQRKEVRDLVASLHDGRLARELALMGEKLSRAFLLIEGDWRWAKGESQRCPGFTRAQYVGVMCSVQVEHGVHVLATASLQETVDTIPRVVTWTSKDSHGSLLARPTAPRGSVRDADVWAAQAWFGRKTALAVVEAFDGLPLTPTCTYEELVAVRGVGPKRARGFIDAFAYTENGDAP